MKLNKGALFRLFLISFIFGTILEMVGAPWWSGLIFGAFMGIFYPEKMWIDS